MIEEFHRLCQGRETEGGGEDGHVDGVEELAEWGYGEVLFFLLVDIGFLGLECA
eukprot:CAMPEP_0201975766 /NCGR_PEP_ID=MMETSP0904-20121228/55076_1 /ASSEMBLY_ACC=CAM_ASM_000553 /TAXON_ID=420261 /ORGANISM="Thalassiosira antarctica, Strain CCMP982" /LENGTH=53 /DNA_ID=CAMNT_0048526641 /DNA_START=91 /DNA_END=248 /DNA_ORIENTATION=+